MLKLALLSWDQKQGAMLEAQVPKFELKENQCMNIYNMHRMREKTASFGQLSLELDRGRKYRALSFYSGFGEGGYGGNYGQHVIGVSEKIVVLFIPSDFESQAYDEVLGTITSRLIFSPEDISSRVVPIGKFLQDKEIAVNPDELKHCMEEKMDEELNLGPDEIAEAQKLEICLHRLVIKELRQQIQDLKARSKTPKQSSSTEIRKLNRQLRSMETRVALFDTERDMFQETRRNYEETIETLTEKHLREKEKMTQYAADLEAEFTAFKISTENHVEELTAVLSEKMAENERLAEKIATLRETKANFKAEDEERDKGSKVHVDSGQINQNQRAHA